MALQKIAKKAPIASWRWMEVGLNPLHSSWILCPQASGMRAGKIILLILSKHLLPFNIFGSTEIHIIHRGAKNLMDHKLHSATQVVQECFWGDYLVTPQDILERLEKKDAAFGRFLFSKIIENSRHPSKHLKALFPMEDLLPMLDRYLSMSGGKKRVRLVAANITGDHSLVPELQWKR